MDKRKIAIGACVGFFIGLFLVIIGLLAIETAGDGTEFFMLIYTAPSGLLPRSVGLLGGLVLWTLFGTLAGGRNSRINRIVLMNLIAVHYLSIPLVLLSSSEPYSTERFRVAYGITGVFLLLSILVYVACQIYLLRITLQPTAKKNDIGEQQPAP